MLAAPGQGDLVAALDAFAEDVGFRSPVTRSRPAGISSLKPRHGREEVAAFFEEILEKVQLERMEALEAIAEEDRRGEEARGVGGLEGRNLFLL